MLLGRPVNIWTGLIQGTTSAILGMTAALLPDEQARIAGVLLGGIGTILGILIAFLANQPPTVSPGDVVRIRTPAGQPDQPVVAALPWVIGPVSDPAPPDPDGDG